MTQFFHRNGIIHFFLVYSNSANFDFQYSSRGRIISAAICHRHPFIERLQKCDSIDLSLDHFLYLPFFAAISDVFHLGWQSQIQSVCQIWTCPFAAFHHFPPCLWPCHHPACLLYALIISGQQGNFQLASGRVDIGLEEIISQIQSSQIEQKNDDKRQKDSSNQSLSNMIPCSN